jgi:hypothetical protein
LKFSATASFSTKKKKKKKTLKICYSFLLPVNPKGKKKGFEPLKFSAAVSVQLKKKKEVIKFLFF